MSKAEEKKKLNPILWFLFAVVIPIIVVATIIIFALSLMNISVFDWLRDKGSDVPVISTVVKKKEEKMLEEKLTKANDTIKTQKEEISNLSREITTLKLTIDDLENSLKIEQSKEKEQNKPKDDEKEEKEPTVVVDGKEIAVSSFRKMEVQNAARIFEALDSTVGANILSELSGKVRGAILAEMDAEKAARITEQIFKK